MSVGRRILDPAWFEFVEYWRSPFLSCCCTDEKVSSSDNGNAFLVVYTRRFLSLWFPSIVHGPVDVTKRIFNYLSRSLEKILFALLLEFSLEKHGMKKQKN